MRKMENGDYVKIQGHLCKIVDRNNTPPIVFDYNVRQRITGKLIRCNIVINEDVLCNCCGFQKTNSQYIITHLHNNTSYFVIRYETTPIKGRCYIDICGQMHRRDWYFEIGADFMLTAGAHTLKICNTNGWFGRFSCVE